MDGEFEGDEPWGDELGGDQFGLDGAGRLDLFGQDEGAAGWDPADYVEPSAADYVEPWEDDGDGPEAWLRSLPPELRAEVEARPR